MKTLQVKTSDLQAGDQVETYPGCPVEHRDTVGAVEMPDPEIEPGCVVATVRTARGFFWSGVNAIHTAHRAE